MPSHKESPASKVWNMRSTWSHWISPVIRLPIFISALAGLHNLQTLIVNNNAATNVSALSNLHSLRELDIHDNGIRDISALSGLSNMQTLILRRNPICNLSALSGMIHLRS